MLAGLDLTQLELRYRREVDPPLEGEALQWIDIKSPTEIGQRI
jgi:hypothetical protein